MAISPSKRGRVYICWFEVQYMVPYTISKTQYPSTMVFRQTCFHINIYVLTHIVGYKNVNTPECHNMKPDYLDFLHKNLTLVCQADMMCGLSGDPGAFVKNVDCRDILFIICIKDSSHLFGIIVHGPHYNRIASNLIYKTIDSMTYTIDVFHLPIFFSLHMVIYTSASVTLQPRESPPIRVTWISAIICVTSSISSWVLMSIILDTFLYWK